MRILIGTTLIAGFIFTGIGRIQAQTAEPKPDQVKLMKQFAGSWKSELGKDTFLISENVSFGSGMISTSKIVTNDKSIDSIKQLYGYDKKIDKFIGAELIQSSPVVEIFTVWFTSENTGEIVVTNPENAPFQFKFEFKSPDMIEQTALRDGKVVKKVTGIRIK